VKLNTGLPWLKKDSTRKRKFRQQIGFKLKEVTTTCYIGM
jgi:hypothetical protein